MTEKEIQRARDMLPNWQYGVPPKYTDEQRLEIEKLDCRDMINSILCYNGTQDVKEDMYLKDYKNKLGDDVVEQLCEEQIADFKKAKVYRDVYTDSDGLSYSRIQWADELQVVYLTDITGTIGQWLDMEFDDEVPIEVLMSLNKAYSLSVNALRSKE